MGWLKGSKFGEIMGRFRQQDESGAEPFTEMEEDEESAELDLSSLPPTLQKLKAYDGQLQERGESLEEGIGVRWTDASMAYHNTPLDVLPFLDMGVDGIHFGLLTDFGNVTDLEEAYVVLIMPADPESSCFVARNAKEFVDYLCSDPHLTVGYNGAVFGSPDEYRQAIADADKDFEDNPDLDNAWQRAAADLQEAMEAEPIADVYRYVFETVPAARKAQTALSTLDGIGVVAGAGETPERFEVDADGAPELATVQAFFATASQAGKFSAIRNLQFTRALFEDAELKEFIMEELEAMGCTNEAARLRMMDW